MYLHLFFFARFPPLDSRKSGFIEREREKKENVEIGAAFYAQFPLSAPRRAQNLGVLERGGSSAPPLFADFSPGKDQMCVEYLQPHTKLKPLEKKEKKHIIVSSKTEEEEEEEDKGGDPPVGGRQISRSETE